MNSSDTVLNWSRSSLCGSGGCVEVASYNRSVLIRTSKNPSGPILHYTAAEWQAFLSGIKSGEFDDLGLDRGKTGLASGKARQGREVVWRADSFGIALGGVEVADDGCSVLIRNRKDPNGPVLAYSLAEWEEFLGGVKCGDFDHTTHDVAKPAMENVTKPASDAAAFIARNSSKLTGNPAGAQNQGKISETSSTPTESPKRPAVKRPTASGSRNVPAVPVSRRWDVFISHASEDKTTAARPLADALRKLGINVWFDAFELKIGDSLRRKIDDGLAHSRFGVVILSPAFFAKDWPQYELDGLVTRGVSGEQRILPIWPGITAAEVIAASPSLADKIARSTDKFTIQEIADEIAEVIRPQSS